MTCHGVKMNTVNLQLFLMILEQQLRKSQFKIPYDMRCYFNVHSKADMIQLNLPHVTNN